MLPLGKTFLRSFICACLLVIAFAGNSQERCGTVEYMKMLQKNKAVPSDDNVFEQWLQIQRYTPRQRIPSTQRTQATYQVPVVVHIIHRGEAVGTGTNISDAQIISQINVLNKDFNRLNTDASDTPAEFTSIAGSMGIEFILAKQDPEGLATTGIVRVQGSNSSWTMNDNYELKSQSYWPAEDYLNIWVCALGDDFLGYTQFPESNLPGLETSSNNRLTDGVVITYDAFGSKDDGNFNLDSRFDRGRTTTHEIGHFFGLRHIWGDDGSSCSGTDYVNDTPNQSKNSSGCPNHPQTTCSVTSMFQNFLDYTYDQCMNLFTQGQVQRMSAVIENSPRRESLLTSHGLQPPTPLANDLGIREIISPLETECNTTVIPTLIVRNYGSNNVTSATIRYSINGVLQETKTFTISNLGYLATEQVSFSPVNITSGTHTFSFEITQTNGVADGVIHNNTLAVTSTVPQFGALPFSEDLETFPNGWTIQNPDEQITWEITTAPNNYTNNKALAIRFYDYEDKLGEVDAVITPVFDLTSVPVASLLFDVAYARYQSSNDRLKVVVLRDCESIDEGTVVYDKAGFELATVSGTTSSFIPTGNDQWRRELINLNQFVGEDHLQLAFVGINDFGNNVYIDNISVVVSIIEDVAVRSVSPSTVTCDVSPAPIVTVQNVGNITITSLKISYSINGEATQTAQATGFTLPSSTEMDIQLPGISLSEGENTISIELTEPNGSVDETPSNNVMEVTVIVKQDSDIIPLRQNFNASFDSWTALNPGGGMNWEPVQTDFETSLYFDAFDNTVIGDQAWLVSPVLDFSQVTEASMVFDLSKKVRPDNQDELRIFASRDCGNTYKQITFNYIGDEEADEWVPLSENDWNQNVTVNLDTLAGEEQVRIAFVAINKNGNNIYLDNIEFFTSNTPQMIEASEQYSLYGYNASDVEESNLKITFNLKERQNVQFSVVDALGRTFADGTLENVLNQTWPLEAELNLSSGMYVVRLKIGNKHYANRIMVGN